MPATFHQQAQAAAGLYCRARQIRQFLEIDFPATSRETLHMLKTACVGGPLHFRATAAAARYPAIRLC
jgi:hypothetical protein